MVSEAYKLGSPCHCWPSLAPHSLWASSCIINPTLNNTRAQRNIQPRLYFRHFPLQFSANDPKSHCHHGSRPPRTRGQGTDFRDTHPAMRLEHPLTRKTHRPGRLSKARPEALVSSATRRRNTKTLPTSMCRPPTPTGLKG